MVIALASCYEDHSDLIPGQDFIPPEILEEIRANGQPIFEGLNPPDVTGRYRISPLELVRSNFPDNNRPDRFGDELIEFSGLDKEQLLLKVSLEQGGNVGEGFGSFISGSENNFTIYVRVDNTDNKGHTTLRTRVYSGTVTNNDITNLYTSLFMINDQGDPNGEYIENGNGRLFKDGDGYSERIN